MKSLDEFYRREEQERIERQNRQRLEEQRRFEEIERQRQFMIKDQLLYERLHSITVSTSNAAGGRLTIPIPTNLAITEDGLTLSWASDYSNFEIWVSIDSAPYYLFGTTTSKTYDLSQIISGDSFDYKVRAFQGTKYSQFTNSVNFTWSEYWMTLSNFFAEGRSGLTIPATKGTSLTILPAVWNNYEGNGYSTIADNGALDIGNNYDFTLWCKVNTIFASKTNTRDIIGKRIASSVNGRYGIGMSATTGYLSSYIQSSGGVVSIASTVDFTTAGWVYLRIDVNQTTKKFRFFINKTQVGSDSTFTGTFAALDPMYKFYIGAGQNSSGVVQSYSNSQHSDSGIFRRILTDTEWATIVDGGYVGDGDDPFWPCNNARSGYNFDASSNGYHLAITTAHWFAETYTASGSTYCLDKGYSLYGDIDGTLNRYLPLTLAGNEITPPSLGTGIIKVKKYDGMESFHNLANSKIQFNDEFWDRSNTTIWNDFARNSGVTLGYYDATDANTKKRFHPRELGNLQISYWLNTGYTGIPFFKMGTNTWFEREKLECIFTLSENVTGALYNKSLVYCGDLPFSAGTYYAIGMGSNYYTSTEPRLLLSRLKEGPFIPFTNITYTERVDTHYGNGKVLQINSNSWLMTHETFGKGLTLAKSVNGVNWEFCMYLPHLQNGDGIGQGCFFVDNDDTTDYRNIHVIGFRPTEGYIYEMHPLNSSYTEWSIPILIFDTGNPKVYNPEIILISGVYHMYYSRFNQGTGTHYMFHATCTENPFLTVNNWTNKDIDDWSGLGDFVESMSFINFGDANWIIYFLDLTSWDQQRYALSDDNCATFGTSVGIYSLSWPLNYSIGMIKLK
jgi:hypothetical protein